MCMSNHAANDNLEVCSFFSSLSSVCGELQKKNNNNRKKNSMWENFVLQ